MITRGSTPTHKFAFPLDFTSMEKVSITYKQFNTVIKKTLPDLVYDKGFLICKLSQDDTLRLIEGNGFPVEIQIKCKDTSGNIKVSNVLTVPVGKLLDEELM